MSAIVFKIPVYCLLYFAFIVFYAGCDRTTELDFYLEPPGDAGVDGGGGESVPEGPDE